MTVSVTMLQTRVGEDGSLWTVAGSPYNASLDFAYFLIGNRFATGTLPTAVQSYPMTQVVATAAEIAALAGQPGVRYVERDGAKREFRWIDGAMVEVGSGGGGGGGSVGSSDLTAAPTIGAYGLTNYTAGADFVITYDGASVPITRHLAGDPTLKADLISGGGGYYYVNGGIKDLSGALVMTLAQFNTWVALSPTVAPGFRVFISDVGSFTDASGNTVVPGGHRTYRGAYLGWRWDYPIFYASQQSTSTTSTSDVVARTWTIPAGVVSDYSDVRVRSRHIATTALTTAAIRWYMNANAIYSNAPSFTIGQEIVVLKTLFSEGPSLQYIIAGITLPYDYTGGITAALTQYSTNYATTPLVMEARISGGSGAGTHTMRSAAVVIDESRML